MDSTNIEFAIAQLKGMGVTDIDRTIKAAKEVIAGLPTAGSTKTVQGLIYGHIQSGKTATLALTAAHAADLHHRLIIVLTADNKWLYRQTEARLRGSLPTLTIFGMDDTEQATAEILKKRSKNNTVLFVSTKNPSRLSTLINRLSSTELTKSFAIIFDDEADQASLNTLEAKPGDEQSRINELIDKLRGLFLGHGYIQVTATPQALFLQNAINGYRPDFTVVTEAGDGYVGGSTFFGDKRDHLLRFVDSTEIQTLKVTNRAPGSATPPIPEGLRRALLSFFVAAALRQLRGSAGDNLKSTFLCHVSLQKRDHENVKEMIEAYVDDIGAALKSDQASAAFRLVGQQVNEAYVDVCMTGVNPSNLDQVIARLTHTIGNSNVQIINSDKELGQPRYDSLYNLLVGGSMLGRGVTIEGLLTTYYGRQPKVAQMDTVLQHARMYGYRQSDLDLTRFFLPSDLAERFESIHDSEDSLRRLLINKNSEVKGILLAGKMRPTRAAVLDMSNVGAYVAGSAYHPRRPIFLKADVSKRTETSDSLLAKYHEGVHDLGSLDLVLETLKIGYGADEPGTGLWDDEGIRSAVIQTANATGINKARLAIRRNSDLSRPIDGIVRQPLAGGELDRVATPSEFTLVMLRLRGEKKRGWDEQAFWIPMLRFPDGNYSLLFNFT